jgi:FkbM family methyltransferase
MFRRLDAHSLSRVARRAFYNAGGPWIRRGLFERLGSRKYSRPARYDLDRRLHELLPDRPGTFVEAGAHDGYTESNTYYLERFRGWSGMLVEAVPELYRKAAKRRRHSTVVNAALVGPERENEEVVLHFGDLTSTLGDPEHARHGLDNSGRRGYEVPVRGRTLSSLLDETGLGAPDLLVLDLEGFELDALRGLDLDRHAPGLIAVEMLDMDAQRPAFDALLGDRYELAGAISPEDALYRLERGR